MVLTLITAIAPERGRKVKRVTPEAAPPDPDAFDPVGADGPAIPDAGTLSPHIRRTLVVGFVLAVLAGVTVLVHHQTDDMIMIAYWYFGVSTSVTFCLVSFVIGRRYLGNPIADGRILCIVPAYNEDPDGLHKTVVALLKQTVPVDIVAIDDGSQIPVRPSLQHPRVDWRRQENTGKRGAQVIVLRSFSRDDYEFVLTVDSQTRTPYPDACEQLLKAMHDPKVQAATGMIYIRNHSESRVSMAADLDIGGSCVMMRASRSILGALETTSGALALLSQRALLYDHLRRLRRRARDRR